MKFKKGQEEIVGFALIIIIVAIILLILLSFSLNSPQKETVESYEVESFLQAVLQYTSDCRDNLEYLSVQKLVFDCSDKLECLDGRETCKALNSTLREVIGESWKIEGDRPIKGYELKIIADEEEMFLIQEGNITANSKGSMQDFSRRGEDYELYFNAYY